MVRTEVSLITKNADVTDASVLTVPGQSGAEQRARGGSLHDTGSSGLLVPPRSELIPNHQDAGNTTVAAPRAHERAITQVTGDADAALIVTNDASDTSGEGSRRRRVRNRPPRDQGGPTTAPPPREPGMAGKEPPPPREPGATAEGESRNQRVERVYREKKAKLARWQEDHVGEPNLLDLTEEAAEGLIPKRLLALVPDPEQVKVRLQRDPQKQMLDRDPQVLTLEFAFVIPSSTPVNNMDIFREALAVQEEQTHEALDHLSLLAFEPQPPPPAGVDPEHWAMPGMVTSETLEMTDIPLAFGRLQKIGSNDDADIFIDDWRVREFLDAVPLREQGITTEANRELEDFGRKQKFKFIVGRNEPRPEPGSEVSVHDIYVYGVGRTPYTENLPEAIKTRFRNRKYLETPSDAERLTFVDLSQPPREVQQTGPTETQEQAAVRIQLALETLSTAIEGIDKNQPLRTVAETVTGLIDTIWPGGKSDERSARAQFLVGAWCNLFRNHVMYDAPSKVRALEEFTRDDINALYERTAILYRRQQLGNAVHNASRNHDLALVDEGTIEQRLQLLALAQKAYQNVVYKRTDDEQTHPEIRKDQNGNAITLSVAHALQARLALAYMPITEARIHGRAIKTEDKFKLNENLATVLDEMLTAEIPEGSLYRTGIDYGYLNEVLDKTLLSRRRGSVITPIAFPPSGVLLLQQGPDAVFPFTENGKHEFTVDWKIQRPGSGRRTGDEITTIPVLRNAFKDLTDPPDLTGSNKSASNIKMLLYTAELLRDEGMQKRHLTDDEMAYLDRAQAALWKNIATKAEDRSGISNLGQKARFLETFPYSEQKAPVMQTVDELRTFIDAHPGYSIVPYLAHKPTDEAWAVSHARVTLNRALPLQVAPPINIADGDTDELAALFQLAQENPAIVAVNITKPHKSNAVLRELFPQHVNVDALIRDETGRMVPLDLNGPSFMDWYENSVGSFEGKTVVLVGAGGAGESIARRIIEKQPAKLVLVDPNTEKARLQQELSEQGNVDYTSTLRNVTVEESDDIVVINAAGQAGEDDPALGGLLQSRAALQRERQIKDIFIDLRSNGDTDIVGRSQELGLQAYTGKGMNARNDYTLISKIAEITGQPLPTFEEWVNIVETAS